MAAPVRLPSNITAPLPQARVLVVDDHPVIRTLVAFFVEEMGHLPLFAESADEALQILRKRPVDAVLLDINMPGVDGFGLLKQIKASPVWQSLPVIMISASDDTASVVQCLELGADDHIHKPILMARLRSSLAAKRLRDEQQRLLAMISREQLRADALLEAILPKHAVRELKETRAVQPLRRERVAVLFADIVGFTPWCEARSPQVVLERLSELVLLQEEAAHRFGLEKIKTIGDAFMAVAGLCGEQPDPVDRAVSAGLAMLDAAPKTRAGFRLRVGVHFGPVIAGVVGRRKHQYDVWGDTVNVAARIEGAARPGTLFLSEAAWGALGGDFRGRHHGTIPLKGKGPTGIVEICRDA